MTMVDKRRIKYCEDPPSQLILHVDNFTEMYHLPKTERR